MMLPGFAYIPIRLFALLALLLAIALPFADARANEPIDFRAARTFGAKEGPIAIAAGNLGGNVAAEIVVANHDDDSITVYPADGEGGFGRPSRYEVGRGPTALVLDDFDQDGDLDAVVACFRNDCLDILYGNGQGGFEREVVSVPAGNGPTSLTKGDFDEDGNVDIAVVSYRSGDLHVMFGDGAGSSTSSAGAGWAAAKASDEQQGARSTVGERRDSSPR